MKRFGFCILALALLLFAIPSTAGAATLNSVYKIGVAQFTNSSESSNAAQFIADTFVTDLPKTINVKVWKIKDEIVFSNKDSIIRVGKQQGVDTVLTGAITEYTVKRDVWLGGIYAKVRVEATLYDAKNGEVMWTGFVTERYHGDTEIHCLQKAARETVWSLKKAMMVSGLQGRAVDNEKPVIEIPDSCFSWTSVYFLDGVVKDNFGIARLLINGEPAVVNSEGRFTFMMPVNNPPVKVELQAEDEGGNITTKQISILKTGALTGNIAQMIGNKIFINKGSLDGVKEGTGFTVSTVQQIKDPSTGEILDSLTTDMGIIKVIEVREKLSIAELVSVLNGGKINIGDTIY